MRVIRQFALFSPKSEYPKSCRPMLASVTISLTPVWFIWFLPIFYISFLIIIRHPTLSSSDLFGRSIFLDYPVKPDNDREVVKPDNDIYSLVIFPWDYPVKPDNDNLGTVSPY